MKIGIIHGFVGGGGGTEKTLDAIIKALLQKKYLISLYTFSKPLLPLQGISIHNVLPFHFPYFGLYQRYMESKLINKAKDEDLIIEASGGFVVPNNMKQKIIIYCHHDFQNELKKSTTKYKGFWSWYYRPYYELTKNFLEKINNENIYLIANSKFVQRSLVDNFNKNSTVIYPPVNLDEFNKPENKENKIITVSRFSEEKNLEFALKVLSSIDVNYNLIGNTKTKANVLHYEHLMKKIHVNSKIKLLRNISRDEVIRNYKTAKVYFHASPETFGITIIESIAAGCIPIVPDNSAHIETVPFSELRYIPNNFNDATDKIKRAMKGEFNHLVESLQKTIAKYSKENFKKSFIDYIEKLLS